VISPLTRENRANLTKLATYLESLPANYKHFSMSSWVRAKNDAAEFRYARENGGVKSCGTAACAAGHGPAAGVLVPERFILSYTVRWWSYAYNEFAGRDSTLMEWLFGGAWTRRGDNHHHGAAARIRYALDHGHAPDGFTEAHRKWLAVYAPYRAASVDTHPKDGDAVAAPLVSGAVPKADAQSPSS
jgi:hypothetical protein